MDSTSAQSFNRYTYVMNNPVNATDRLGLLTECEGGIPCPFQICVGDGGPCMNRASGWTVSFGAMLAGDWGDYARRGETREFLTGKSGDRKL